MRTNNWSKQKQFACLCCHPNSSSALLSNTWSRQWEWGRIVFFVMHTLLPVTTCYNVTFGISTLHTLHYMLQVLHRTRHKSDVYMELWWRININILCYQLNWWLNVAHITHSFTLNCQPWTVTLVSRILGHTIILLHPPTLAWRW